MKKSSYIQHAQIDFRDCAKMFYFQFNSLILQAEYQLCAILNQWRLLFGVLQDSTGLIGVTTA